MNTFTINQLNDLLDGTLIGHTDQEIHGPEQMEKAKENHITFIGNAKYANLWKKSDASVAIVNEGLEVEQLENKALIQVKNADLAMAKVLEIFAPRLPEFSSDIHPTAVIDTTAKIGAGSKIGAGCYVGKDVILGENVTLFPNVTVLDESEIGDNTTIWSGAVIRERTIMGKNCIIHNNVSIGADGFGFRPDMSSGDLVKIPQIGNVEIGDNVEIGANSTVDRGKFSATVIGDGCKIDNLVQIGHNSVMGRYCIMAGHSGLAGSVTLGDGVIIGGSASIKDHVTLHSGVTVGAGSGVLNDVAPGKTVLGYPACESRDMLKQWVTLRKLAKK
ncbi:UDP-3-O-(3-hydroxymyristoyl)glucosamine N-acyltransferase [Aureivirga sp. CE67]|uniref:UDP-3-O-(3-hydroxymyristoyl)glucosamine N-acyltransferase n=1 Tax=Aureivirga sp. CE67 TaxID=1788983 RepID=UPI0018C932CA|nr:UDP-3-O-(3-hydroxymyristoyl)glucosamine N-acyltransferase [Aureivirga sp. CE67]